MSATIFVIDDEESIRFTFESFLAKEGHAVFTAADYAAAERLFSTHRPDLVFADIALAGRSGIELLASIREAGLRCPVIMITGQPDIETATESVRLGAYDYLSKPVRKDTLLRVAAMALAHKALVDEKERATAENIRNRKYLEAVFHAVREGILTVDTAGVVTGANPAAAKILDMPSESMTGRSFGDLDRECATNCRPLLERTLKRGESATDVPVECGEEGRRRVLNVSSAPLRDGETSLGAVLVLRDVTRITTLERELGARSRFHHMVGKSERMQAIYRLIEELSDTETTVLVTGESGTGKELVAQALHYGGTRRNGPLIGVNCSALAETLLESELFGHVKGSFTGATRDKKGRFELAAGGTVFLDEIGDISPLIQSKLLRVLQEKVFERVGDPRPRTLDARIISATHRDLKSLVAQGRFREDLYYRLKVLEIPMPPLRERLEDIPSLVDHFVQRFRESMNRPIQGVSEEVMGLFLRHSWPGNIRELRHAVEHAFVLCREDIIAPRHLPPEIFQSPSPLPVHPVGMALRNGLGREELEAALAATGGNRAAAARYLGVSRQTIYRKLAEFGMEEGGMGRHSSP